MSFINPIFLAALATAALPILYHLVRRIQAKQVQFSSLMFLKMTPKEVVRRRRIQHWLLMVMRCALLGLLAFAFARPFIPQDQIPFVAQRENESVVLLLDTSFSMQYALGGERTLLEEAKEAALARLGEAEGDDEYSIIAFSDRTVQLTPLDADRTIHSNAIQSLVEPTYRTTDFYSAIRLAEDVLASATHEKKRITLISDLQQNGWQGAFENWKLNAAIDFEMINIAGDEERANNILDGFSLTERRVEGRVVHRFNARVGTSDEDGTLPMNAVDLEIEGDKVNEQRVGGDELRRASFQYQASREGTFVGSVRLQEDDLSIDDVRYFAFEVENKPELLSVGGSARDITRDTYYLDRAFNQGDQALYVLNIGGSGPVNQSSLRDQQVVFLSSPAPTSAEVNTLRRFVMEGGSLVISFNPQSNIEAYNRLLGGLEAGQISSFVRSRSEQGYDAIIGEVDLRHPVFSVFTESGSGAIFRPKFRDFARVQADSSATVLGRFDTGDPFLIEKELGQGRVLVYTSSLSPAWTDFTINEMYVPFLYQLVKYALAANEVKKEYFVGESVRFEGDPGTEWEVQGPGNSLYKVPIDETGQGFFRDTDIPGHYYVAGNGEQVVFVVNVDPGEGLLTSRNAEEAYGAVVPPPEEAPVTVEEARLMEIDDEERQQKFWRYVILLMVLLYATETFVANRIKK